jgi:hypothetical protein
LYVTFTFSQYPSAKLPATQLSCISPLVLSTTNKPTRKADSKAKCGIERARLKPDQG